MRHPFDVRRLRPGPGWRKAAPRDDDPGRRWRGRDDTGVVAQHVDGAEAAAVRRTVIQKRKAAKKVAVSKKKGKKYNVVYRDANSLSVWVDLGDDPLED